MAKRNEPTHITRGSVLDDLGFSPEKAAILKMKAEFHAELIRSARNYSPKELQTILKEPQPRVSEFLNGKIASVSLEKMSVYAFRLGSKPTIRLKLNTKQTKAVARKTANSVRVTGSKQRTAAAL
ncbi:MAG: hypothetical protein CXZ00_16490 [Acidobacteria bacterium]|nr:MAG: hypothetical protein CXZ00_16490 [Acidobacteriota bacterium]